MDREYDILKLRYELQEQKETNNFKISTYESLINKMQGFKEKTNNEHHLLQDLKRLVNYFELKNDVVDIKLSNI